MVMREVGARRRVGPVAAALVFGGQVIPSQRDVLCLVPLLSLLSLLSLLTLWPLSRSLSGLGWLPGEGRKPACSLLPRLAHREARYASRGPLARPSVLVPPRLSWPLSALLAWLLALAGPLPRVLALPLTWHPKSSGELGHRGRRDARYQGEEHGPPEGRLVRGSHGAVGRSTSTVVTSREEKNASTADERVWTAQDGLGLRGSERIAKGGRPACGSYPSSRRGGGGARAGDTRRGHISPRWRIWPLCKFLLLYRELPDGPKVTCPAQPVARRGPRTTGAAWAARAQSRHQGHSAQSRKITDPAVQRISPSAVGPCGLRF